MQTFLDGKVTLLSGDSAELIKTLPDNSIDSVVCDPPYALVSIVKRFGGANAAPAKGNDAYMRASAGFMGKQWDTGEVAFDPAFWAEILRVLKPGGHLVAFSGTRTYHRMAVAIEDAGFEIRDQLAWCYGSGFPKSHNVSKGLDKKVGAVRSKVKVSADAPLISGSVGNTRPWMDDPEHELDGPDPVSEEAKVWDGWGTALKPAWEPICLGRKSIVGTVAENVLANGVGALNIDGCRIESSAADQAYISERINGFNNVRSIGGNGAYGGGETMDRGASYDASKGRWPANLLLDGSEEVLAAFPDAPGQGGSVSMGSPSSLIDNVYGARNRIPSENPRTDIGSAARFFYTAKADATDRLGSKHPTVKPLDLMQWLVRLVTPKGGTCLDPFAGTGTTGEAAWREGCKAILMEREPEYQQDIKKRMELANNPTLRDAAARSKRVLANLKESDTMALFGTEDA